MIEINLLPHREAKRVADLRQNAAILILGVVLAVGGVFMANSRLEGQRSHADANLRQLRADIERYKPQQKKVAAFKKQKKELEEKLGVIDGLEAARSGPVRILDELARHTPERLWLTRLTTEGSQVKVEGESLDTGVVADFLRELNSSKFFVNVDLEKTNRGKEVEGVKLVNFTVTAELTNPADTGAEPKAKKGA